MKIVLEMDIETAAYLSRACEIIARILIYQFSDMIELLCPGMKYEERKDLEAIMRHRLHFQEPEDSRKRPQECNVAWDVYQHLRRELAWHRFGKDWRIDKRDRSTMMGVSFDEPMNTSGASLSVEVR